MFIVVNKALEIAKIHKRELNNIIFVGGQTRTPKIEEMVKNFFGKIEILKSLNVEEVVAYGAALSGNQNLIIEDTISKSIGIETANNIMSEIIPMGTNLPTSGKIITYSKLFLVEGNPKVQKIKIYEGNSKNIKENDYLGGFILNLEEDEKLITINMKIDYYLILYVNTVVNDKKKEDQITEMKPINKLDLINIEF